MADFKEIKTQEEFDAAIKERLERERAKFKDYDDLKKQAGEADGYKKQLEVANAKIGELEKSAEESEEKLAGHAKEVSDLTDRATKAERSLLRFKIAEENHIPTSLADRLTGETEEELRKDAAAFAKFVSAPMAAPLATNEPAAGYQINTMDAAIASLSEQMKGAT